MMVEGINYDVISKSLGRTPGTLSTWRRWMVEGGLAKLFQWEYQGRIAELDKVPEKKTALLEHLASLPVKKAKNAQHIIADMTGIKLGLTAVREFLKREGARYKKPAQAPPKADDIEVQEAQAQYLDETLMPLLQQAAKGEVEVYFLDAVHLLRKPALERCWMFSNLFVRATPGRDRYNVLGALNAVTHELVHIATAENISFNFVEPLLIALREKHPDKPIHVVLDNARYQHNAAVRGVAEAYNIQMDYLPAYSPNLNLIERMWKFLRKEVMANSYFSTKEAFRHAINDFLKRYNTDYLSKVKQLFAWNFQTFNNCVFLPF
jgi:transposase